MYAVESTNYRRTPLHSNLKKHIYCSQNWSTALVNSVMNSDTLRCNDITCG